MRLLRIPISGGFAICAGLLLLSLGFLSCERRANVVNFSPKEPPAQPVELTGEQLSARGQVLYSKHCAVCHGPQGLGDGAAAWLLYPKPRNFSEGQFRLTSTASGLPTDEDLLQTLKRGMPGSAMPSWAHLGEQDLKALVLTVRKLAIDGKVSQLLAKSKNPDPAKALATAHELFDPGPQVEIPAQPPAAEIDPKLGQTVYLANCAACHGEDGRAVGKTDMTDISGFPSYARDFTQGVFKGSPQGLDLARRITRGLPGSPMPGQPMPAKELWSLVNYIQGMIKSGAQERVLQTQKLLTANRVAAVPNDPEDAQWEKINSVFLPVMPLWWRNDRIEGVSFRAVHDDRSLAIQLSWRDSTVNDLATKPQSFTDGVALQISFDSDPPFFGMGGKEGQVTIWHWKSTWQRDLSADADAMAATYRNMPHDTTYSPVLRDGYAAAVQAGNPVAQLRHDSSVETLAARGQGTLTSQPRIATTVQGVGRWKDGWWRVVFVRPLAAKDTAEASFSVGKELSIAAAVWDGQAGDRNGQKAVTIWHRLVLSK